MTIKRLDAFLKSASDDEDVWLIIRQVDLSALENSAHFENTLLIPEGKQIQWLQNLKHIRVSRNNIFSYEMFLTNLSKIFFILTSGKYNFSICVF